MYLAFGPIIIRWYTLILILAILLPYFLIRKKAKNFKLETGDIDNLLLLIIPLGVVGARLYHVIDKWQFYQSHFPEIFFIWQGGLGIFGGLLLGFLGILIYSKFKKLNLLNLLDLFACYLLLGQAIGRLGNYFNGEGFGPATNLPWGIYVKGQYVHPTFFYEALWDLIGFIILYWLSKRKLKKGLLTSVYLIIYGSGRVLAEVFRIDTAHIGEVKVGFLVGSLMVLAGLFLVFKFNTIGSNSYESRPK